MWVKHRSASILRQQHAGRSRVPPSMISLWTSDAPEDWQAALDRYERVIAEQGVARLPELDSWYRDELPTKIAARRPGYVTLDELVTVTEWKMARGVWRGRNLALVRGNA